MTIKFMVSIALVAVLAQASSALACPDNVSKMKSDYLPPGIPSLCALSDRYEAAVANLKLKGITNPERISDVLAPRFINMPDWVKARESHNYSPWMVYPPAPQTWSSWERGRDYIERQAQENLRRHRGPHLDRGWLQKLHQTALDRLMDHAGEFRTGPEIGRALVPSYALSVDEVSAVRSPDYMTSFTGQPIIKWHASECVADQAGPFVLSLHPEIGPDKFFTDTDGKQKQCGFFEYTTPASDVPAMLDHWMDAINQASRSWGKKDPKGDPILIAARAQRWYVAIHPFVHGNGRTSRLTMDLLLESLELPTPLLLDMNKDTVSTEPIWVSMVSEGMLRHIEVLEACATDTSQKGCNEVSLTP